MPQNYDPITGTYHADPFWKRYQQPAVQGLQDLQMPEPPAPPLEFDSKSYSTPPQVPDDAWGYSGPKHPMEAAGDIDMPAPPPSPAKWGPSGFPSGLELLKQNAARPSAGGDDFGTRADNLISDAAAREQAFRQSTPAMAATQGLKAAEPTSGVTPVTHQFGPESAKPAPMPTQAEALSILTGGQGGDMGPHRMSSDLEAFQNLLNMRRSGMPARDEDFLNQAIQSQIAGSAARSKELEDYRDKTRREGLEEEKLRQPLAINKAKAEAAMALERAKGEQGMELQKEKGREALELQETPMAQQQNFLDQMARMRMAGQDVSGFTLPGKGGAGGHISFAPEKGVSPSLQTELSKAEGNLAGKQGYFGPDPAAQARQQQDVNNILAASPTAKKFPHLRDLVMQAKNNPKYAGRTFEQIFNADPAEEAALRQIWTEVGGR